MNVPRSINLADDLNRKGVVEGYRPTRKSLEVVRAVCGTGGSRATHVVAPYGAGKSIAALAGLTLLSGPPKRAACLRGRISSVDSGFSGAFDVPQEASLVVLLHGAHPDLAAELCRQAGVKRRNRMDGALKAVLARAKKDGIQHIAIVWDEFGQHLETLVREGRSEDLLAVQDLAEWAVRRQTPVVTFTTLMHKGVRNYARRAADDARTAWQKIEGRFDTLSLIDDGVDVYEMVADTLDGARGADCRDLARRARDIGFFPAFGDDEALSHVLARTAPLTPAALDVLPRLASLVAQNERTMFRCLEETSTRAGPGGAVGLDALYDYFSPSMRADTGAGGTHRRLVEAETALSRAETDLQRMVVKSAALLQLGRATERTRLPRGRLLFAVTEGTGAARDDAEAAVAALVERKVLLHRRRVDDMSVWHGADIDLTGMVAEEAARVSAEMDIVSTLERAFPPDAYTSPRYNHGWSITRFARARFALTRDLLDPDRRERLRAEADAEDALVALVLDGAPAGRGLDEAVRTMPRHFIAALPHRPTEVGAILADLVATEELLERPELLETDPLVRRELDELRAEADSTLRRELDRVMNLDRGEVTWKLGGGGGLPRPSRRKPAGHLPAGDLLTDIFEARFPETPRIRNEQVVRRRVSTVTRSARKRCILAVIERTGLPALGYRGATSADASIYRTVFENTGLYRSADGHWSWASPDELPDPGMRSVWETLRDFFASPADQPKPFDDLLDHLTAPPVGLREGVLPLMVAAGLQAFARSTALRETTDRRRYVDDITATVVERICESPSRFDVEVVAFGKAQTRRLEKLVCEVAGAIDPHEPDLVRAFYDGVIQWKSGLPPSVWAAGGAGPRTAEVQRLLGRRDLDPLRFITRDLPRALDGRPLSAECLRVFQSAAREMERAAKTFADKAAGIAEERFNDRISGARLPLLRAAKAWADTLPVDDGMARTLDREAHGILSRARTAPKTPRGRHGFVTALNGILSGTGFEDWDEGAVAAFGDSLEAAILRVEDLVLENADDSPEFEPFLRNHLASVFDRYGARIGHERLMHHLDGIYRERT